MKRFLLGLLLLPVVSAAAEEPLDFNRDVRPILSAHCFKCHGPDETTREASLRLDIREEALGEADSGERAIVPGEPDASELVRRIFAESEFEIMPPPATKHPLDEVQKGVLKRWIREGAKYEPHWAFVPPVRPALPKVADAEWLRNPIDSFALARLEAAGLQPAEPADRYTLVRRVYLDLIGLPPTPEQADQFVHDSAPNAYERLVDRLLASPHYGERWARRWLDLARYADTNGYEKDRPRTMWPWRDWVINALNADMSFDRFTIEQLAGDMLPEATVKQRIATGFHRNTMINEEGGIDPLEFRFHAMTDRVGTTATVWLGLTLACAQCHTHKYDPLPQREYYQFMAFLNNADEVKLPVPDPELTSRRESLEQQIAEQWAALPEKFPLPAPDSNSNLNSDSEPKGNSEDEAGDSQTVEQRRAMLLQSRYRQWLAEQRQQAVEWQPLTPVEMSTNLPRLEALPDNSVLASGDQTKSDTYRLTFREMLTGNLSGVTAIRLEALPHESLPLGGPGRTYYEGPEGDFFLSEFKLQVDGKPVRIAAATEDYAKLGIGGGASSAALAVDGEMQTGWSTHGQEGQPHQAVFRLSEPLADGTVASLEMNFERHYSADLGRFRVLVTRDARDVVAKAMPADMERLLLLPEDDWTEQQQQQMWRYFLRVCPELEEARKEITQLESQLPSLPMTLVFEERPADYPRPTYRHHRGEYLSPKEEVQPHELTLLHSMPADAPRNRLTFARWLVDERNPLVARVTVNRQWAAFFGAGLVETTEDFGYQGAPPSHPEMLDWLAVEFMHRGWSPKKLHRLIVTSATYRQASVATDEKLRLDPENRLFSRGPRVRLEAELVRDSLLTISGQLTHHIGGPSVFPPQPASVTTEGAYGRLQWTVSDGEDRYRRGLYTFAKRTTPYAMFITFDGPSGEACVPRRETSNTPLQALTLLNDTVAVEAAQWLGREMAARDLEDSAKIEQLFRRVLVRPPDAQEQALMQDFYAAQRQHLAAHPQQAAKLMGVEVAADGSKDNSVEERASEEGAAAGGVAMDAIVEQAVWTALARSLLNLDETVTKR